ncbi:hypothetical protein CAOG_03669 [Capsaspora owczarzaki ATCC 30864]|uniref:Uncharacterized protein n=1 Tax=Capsaspora owczarzaki (strain ATCC 30864) TaxID=595528 RepID=A0A0D2WPT3_CAPO3|nr:hypothetical protein CAOG_03669 [Capsaspora owczarzaki ATCC 30864]KJE92763.1 hypothetical protein CAOG_003669 [Capsaspora owczarzaki ATCC 30864]|eukprot:XP_004363397.1 hypothetical protein CAOG_03669 [Capsaspora owczarzaki ATCC 30864]
MPSANAPTMTSATASNRGKRSFSAPKEVNRSLLDEHDAMNDAIFEAEHDASAMVSQPGRNGTGFSLASSMSHHELTIVGSSESLNDMSFATLWRHQRSESLGDLSRSTSLDSSPSNSPPGDSYRAPSFFHRLKARHVERRSSRLNDREILAASDMPKAWKA